jgi:hypothetical protein
MTREQAQELISLGELYARTHEEGLQLGDASGPLLRAAVHEIGPTEVLEWAYKRMTQQNKEIYSAIVGAAATVLMVGLDAGPTD